MYVYANTVFNTQIFTGTTSTGNTTTAVLVYTNACPMCGYWGRHGSNCPVWDRDVLERELDELEGELGLLEAELERNRRAYRPLVRARRRNLHAELAPTTCLARVPRPVPRRRARAEPMGLRNYQRQDAR